MQILKDLLEATIKYQDVMDELLSDYTVSHLQIVMLDLADEAKNRYPSLMAQYDFG